MSIKYVPFILRPPFQEPKVDNNEYIEYDVCNTCNTVYSSEMMKWNPERFSKKCYNENYKIYDRDITKINSVRNMFMLNYISKNCEDKSIKYLDYGGNQGFLVSLLKQKGYVNGNCYDPFTCNCNQHLLEDKYDLITCIEVMEHAFNINEIFSLFQRILNDTGKIIISTCFYNNENLLTWWYCCPRIGHILFFTKQGFAEFALKYGFKIEKIEPFTSMQIITLVKI